MTYRRRRGGKTTTTTTTTRRKCDANGFLLKTIEVVVVVSFLARDAFLFGTAEFNNAGAMTSSSSSSDAGDGFFNTTTSSSSSSSTTTNAAKRTRRPTAAAYTVAPISATALAVKEAHPTYEERCFKGKTVWWEKLCWYCDPTQCAPTKNYEDLDSINGDCPDEACNRFNKDESWKAYDFGCGLERNWCMSGGSVYTSVGWFSTTTTSCRAELTRSSDNCNCASTNSVWPEVWDKTEERLTDIGCGCGVTSCRQERACNLSSNPGISE